MTNNKNINKKFIFAISSKTFITVILLIGLVASPLTANNLPSIDMTYAEEGQQQKQEQIQQQHQQHQLQIANINHDKSE
jgi:hypothetical protein